MKIKLSRILTDSGTQVRATIDAVTVKDYAEAMRIESPDSTKKFPPIIVFDTGEDKLVLADGFHRVEAAKENDFTDIEAEVRKGTRAEALKCALGANTSHGLRLTNADKRRSVELALKEWPTLSDNELGRICAVHHSTVAAVRREIQPAKLASSPRAGGDGKVRRLPPPRAKFGQPPLRARPLPTATPAKPATSASDGPKDDTGLPIPLGVRALWEKAVEAEEVLSFLSTARSRLRKAQEAGNVLYVEVNFSSALSSIDQAYADVKVVKPYAVCPTCQGKFMEDCLACKQRGFVSKFYWDNCVPEEAKKMRTNGAAAKEAAS